ncbi:MAG: hypothetical protein B7X41_12620 [Microbacterium sp. 14-71-5]|nr:MAG: hypothetical protein B7X41_12620 [Microbacterium sp. 14-71-5]
MRAQPVLGTDTARAAAAARDWWYPAAASAAKNSSGSACSTQVRVHAAPCARALPTCSDVPSQVASAISQCSVTTATVPRARTASTNVSRPAAADAPTGAASARRGRVRTVAAEAPRIG